MATVYEEGLRVKHPQYGVGTILESDEERTSIDFSDHGTKKFVTSLVTLEVTEDQPKSKRKRRSSPRSSNGNGARRRARVKKAKA